MSKWTRFAVAAVVGVAVVGCGANGGDPVAGQQIPAGPADSPQQSADSGSGAGSDAGSESGSNQGGSDQAGSGGGGSGGSDQGGSDRGGSGGGGSGSGDGPGRKVGLPKSIRIPEIGQQAFEDAVVAACGSREGAPDCLTVTYVTGDDPGKCGAVEWVSDPPKDSSAGDGVSIVQRGSTITATVFTCAESEETTSPAPEETTSAPPEDDETSTSETPTASP